MLPYLPYFTLKLYNIFLYFTSAFDQKIDNKFPKCLRFKKKSSHIYAGLEDL